MKFCAKGKTSNESAEDASRKRNVCKKCDKTFTTRHDKLNHKIQMFPCEKCDKTFVLKLRLMKH